MFKDSETNAAGCERLSALVDGELDDTLAAQACAQWRENAGMRATWHAYHLIGDVLRSDDLACVPAHDAGFLCALRARLANEPVVLAPRPLEAAAPSPVPLAARAASGGRRRSWIAPTAVAAGFVAVAGVLTLTRPGPLPDRSGGDTVAQVAPATSLAEAGPLTAASTRLGPAVLPAEPQTFVASGQVIRDARLDRYLAAHKQFAGSSALGVPSAYLRNATVEVSGR